MELKSRPLLAFLRDPRRKLPRALWLQGSGIAARGGKRSKIGFEEIVAKSVTKRGMLSDVIPYHGRYPVPRAAQDLKPESYISDDIHQACKVLFDRLELQLYRLNFEGIDAPEGVRFSSLRLTHRDGDADFVTDEHKFEHEKLRTDFLRKIRGSES